MIIVIPAPWVKWEKVKNMQDNLNAAQRYSAIPFLNLHFC